MTRTVPAVGSDAGRLVAAVVALHLGVTAVHGIAHATIPVPIADWQGLYTAVVLFGLPVGAVVARRRGAVTACAWLLLVAGVGAFAFEALFHFVIDSPDHVAAVEHSRALFGVTATLSTASDTLLAATGGWLLWRHRQGSSATSSSVSQT